jgi:hypothetical protein
VKEHLVRKCSEWPGLTSLPLMVGTPHRTFRWFNWTRRWKARGSPERLRRLSERWAEPEQFRLALLPGWVATPLSRRRRLLRRAVETIEREAAAAKHRVLGRSRVLAQDPQHRPARPARALRPLCHASERSRRVEFRERYRAFAAAVRRASQNWRRGAFNTAFPEIAFRPFLWPIPFDPALAA